MFLETLVDFILVHKDDLQDWLFVLLTQLLKKMGADLLGSVQAKVQRALDVTRWVSHSRRDKAFKNRDFKEVAPRECCFSKSKKL